MSFLLIKFEADYADEFDVSGIMLQTSSWYEQHMKNAQELFNKRSSREVYFGTNEAVQYEGFDSYKRAFTVTELTHEEYSLFLHRIGPYFGHVCLVEE